MNSQTDLAPTGSHSLSFFKILPADSTRHIHLFSLNIYDING